MAKKSDKKNKKIGGGNITTSTGDLVGSLYDMYNTDKAKAGYEKAMNTAIANQQKSYGQASDMLKDAYGVSGDANRNLYNYSMGQFNKINPKIVKNLTNNKNYNQGAIRNNLTGLYQYAKSNLSRGGALLQQNLNRSNNFANSAYNNQRSDLMNQYNKAIDSFNPYTQGGQQAQGLLTKFLTGDPNTRAEDYAKTAGYQFQFDEGLGALDRSAAARGGLMSGQYMKDLTKYGQGMAQTGYNNYLSQLSGLAGQGLQATNAQAGYRGTLGNNLSDIRGALGQTMIGNQNTYTQGYGNQLNNYYNTVAQNKNASTNQNLANMQNYYNNMNNNLSNQYNVRSGLNADYNAGLASNALNRATSLGNLNLSNTGAINDMLQSKALGTYNATRQVGDATSAGAAALGQVAGSALGNVDLSGALNKGINYLAGLF